MQSAVSESVCPGKTNNDYENRGVISQMPGATPWSSGNTIASRKRGPGSNPGCGEMLSARKDWESMRVVDATNLNIGT